MVAFRMDICACKEVAGLNKVAQIAGKEGRKDKSSLISPLTKNRFLWPSPRIVFTNAYHFFLCVLAEIYPGAIAGDMRHNRYRTCK